MSEQTLLKEFMDVPIDNRRVSIFVFQKKKECNKYDEKSKISDN
jgi:hypothetical protein